MIYGIELTTIKACILAGLYPLLLFVLCSLNKKNILKYIVTVLFLSYAFYLENRTALFCIMLTFIYFHQGLINKLRKKWIFIIAICISSILLLVKYNSFLGRVFIWKIIFLNSNKVGLTGLGYGSFKTQYADWQSAYFASNPQWSKFHHLADAPSFAFNEIIHYYIEFGIIAIVIFIFFLIINRRLFASQKKAVHYFACSNLVILLFSIISYPFHSIWIITLFVINHLLILFILYYEIRIPILLLAISIMMFTINMFFKYNSAVSTWHYAQTIPISSFSDKNQCYQTSYNTLYDNQYFLNDYCNFFLSNNMFDSAIFIANHNKNNMNQYERELVLGNAYFEKNEPLQSIIHFEKAHSIIPNRFIPLNCLMQLALSMKDINLAKKYARQIIMMPVKLNSYIVSNSKQQAATVLTK